MGLPAPSKIVAVGLNYVEHVDESVDFDTKLATIPNEPVLFVKTPNTLVGSGDNIELPWYGDRRQLRTDLEAELAVVIGKTARNVSEDDALEHVAGFTCFNDVSQREIQMADVSGWTRGKCMDTFGPIGPRVVSMDSIGSFDNLRISARINGETVQDASTADMIFGIPTLIAYISRYMTLEPGDIIATGTPSGVSPIAAGDEVEIEIEGIGILTNTAIEAAVSLNG